MIDIPLDYGRWIDPLWVPSGPLDVAGSVTGLALYMGEEPEDGGPIVRQGRYDAGFGFIDSTTAQRVEPVSWSRPSDAARDVAGWRLVDGIRVYTVESSITGHRREFVALEDFQAAALTPQAAEQDRGVLLNLMDWATEAANRLGPEQHEVRDRLRSAVAMAAKDAGPAPAVDLTPNLYVPGRCYCPKCNFVLTKANLYMGNGTTGPGNTVGEECPNCKTAMWRVSWEQEARQCWERMEESLGWVVGNADGTAWRCWVNAGPTWTDNPDKATRYARREDAEAVHGEDEDAWHIYNYAEVIRNG